MSSLTKVALVQMKMDADSKKNLSKAIEKIKLAKKKGAQIVCLPELFLTHYFCQEENHDNFAIAEKIPCLLYTSPSPRDVEESRMPSSA